MINLYQSNNHMASLASCVRIENDHTTLLVNYWIATVASNPSIYPLLLEGLQAEVQQSTFCPLGSRAFQSQTWLCKIDARNCVDILSYRTNRRNFLHRFAKPCLASQCSLAQRAKCGLLHYCLEHFNTDRFDWISFDSYWYIAAASAKMKVRP